MAPKVLILPSWYISPGDRINGSFFQAQGELISGSFDTRALHVKIRGQPSLGAASRRPRYFAKWWLERLRWKRRLVSLADGLVFRTSELFVYEQKVISFREQSTYKQSGRNYICRLG